MIINAYICNANGKIMPQKYKTMEQKTKFRKLYDALPSSRVVSPKKRWVEDVALAARVHPATVRCWLAGTQKPDALRTEIVAKHLGVSPENLF
jgi:hypothetical protein